MKSEEKLSTIKVPAELWERLRVVAEREYAPVSVLARRVLDEFVRETERKWEQK